MAWFKYRGKVAPHSTDWRGASVSPRRAVLESLYAWERRARGYDLYPAPVALEPAFSRFDPAVTAEQWAGIPQPPCRADPAQLSYASLLMPVGPDLSSSRRDAALQGVHPAHVVAYLGALRSLRGPLALEIIATSSGIRYQVGCARDELQEVQAALAAQFPVARLDATPDVLLAALQGLEPETCGQCIVDLGLAEAVYRPLPCADKFEPDPHGALLAALGSLQQGEVAGLQLLLAAASSHWGEELERFLLYFDGDGTKAGDQREKALGRKLSGPLWCASLKVFAFAGSRDPASNAPASNAHASNAHRAADLCVRVAATLDSLPAGSSSAGSSSSRSSQTALSNRLLALDDGDYETGRNDGESEHRRDLLTRRSRRGGMLLGAGELAALWHPPSPSLRHKRLLRYDPSRRGLPDNLREARGTALGVLTGSNGPQSESTAETEVQLVPWPDSYRNRHFYMLGATRMGKSTLLHNMIVQDLWAGRGLCLIDPHGDLAHDVLSTIPPQRENDVLFLDLSDTAHPPALGLLQAGSEWEKRLLVSDLLSILHRVFASSWGDRLEHILRHALLTLLADDGPDAPAHTLRDIRSLLAEEAYREDLLERLREPDLVSFWRSEFPGYSSSAFAPIYNKLGLLLSSPVVRNVVAGRESKLDPARLIRERRVLVVNLAGSLIGQDNAHFLGALLVSKIQLAAMQGLRHGQSQRVPFTLYVDEFQNFVVSSFETILSEAGKAGLSLVMANQFLEQLGESLQSAILSNVGSLVSFRVSAPSGRRLEGEFGGLFSATELTDLERGQAVVRLGKAGDSFALRTFAPVTPDEVGATLGAAQRIVTATRREVCRPREDVEAELRDDESRLRELRAAWQAEQERKKEEQKQRAAKTKAEAKAKSEPKPAGRSDPADQRRGSVAVNSDAGKEAHDPNEARVSSPNRGTSRHWADDGAAGYSVTDPFAADASSPDSDPAKPRPTGTSSPTASSAPPPTAPLFFGLHDPPSESECKDDPSPGEPPEAHGAESPQGKNANRESDVQP